MVLEKWFWCVFCNISQNANARKTVYRNFSLKSGKLVVPGNNNNITMSEEFECYSSISVLPCMILMSISAVTGGMIAMWSSYRLCTDKSPLKPKYKCLSIWC